MAFPGDQNVPIDASPSLPVLLFACALCLVTGILFGVAPAWIAARVQPADALRTGSRTTSTKASLLQRSLVVLQAALSLVLLIGAGLFAQSLNKLQSTDLKLDPAIATSSTSIPRPPAIRGSQLAPLYQAFEDRFHAIPGVVHVGFWATYTPMEDDNWAIGVQSGRVDRAHHGASTVWVSPEYFDSVGTRVLIGRGFTRQDTPTSPSVAVVNKTFVKDFFPKGVRPHRPTLRPRRTQHSR